MQNLEEKSPFLQRDALSKCLCKGYKIKRPYTPPRASLPRVTLARTPHMEPFSSTAQKNTGKHVTSVVKVKKLPVVCHQGQKFEFSKRGTLAHLDI